jgi:glycosyltransferase involved in cell wall biosynthesis
MNDHKITIVHVVDSLSQGGREKVVIDICNNLNKDKFRIIILTLSNNFNTLKYSIKENITVIEIPCNYRWLEGIRVIFFWIVAFPVILKTFRRLKPEIVHLHLLFHKILLLSIALKFSSFKSKVFITIHTSGLYYISKKLIDRFRLFIEQISVIISKAHIIGISEIVHRNNIKYFGSKSITCSYVPNGVDLSKYKKYENNRIDFGYQTTDIIVVYVGRFDEGKNHLTLLKAWEIVKREINNNLKLILIGDGILKEKITEFISAHKLSDSILLTGNINNVSEFLNISDFGVIPSSFEGFPLVLIEKMAMQLPVLTSSIDIFKTIIKNGNNGFVFNTFDYQELANLLLYMSNNLDLVRKMGINARNTALNFSLETTIQIQESLYLTELKLC